MKKKNKKLIAKIVILLLILASFYFQDDITKFLNNNIETSYAVDSVPEYSGSEYIIINDNVPEFAESDFTTESFEEYSELDSLGRCYIIVVI